MSNFNYQGRPTVGLCLTYTKWEKEKQSQEEWGSLKFSCKVAEDKISTHKMWKWTVGKAPVCQKKVKKTQNVTCSAVGMCWEKPTVSLLVESFAIRKHNEAWDLYKINTEQERSSLASNLFRCAPNIYWPQTHFLTYVCNSYVGISSSFLSLFRFLALTALFEG